MSILSTSKRRSEQAAAEAAEAAADEVALRSRADQVVALLRALDGELQEAEAQREKALADIAALRVSPGSAVALWRAEERLESARDRIENLLGERRPLDAERRRLLGYLQPLDAQRTRLEAARQRLGHYERLAEVLPQLDAVVEAVEAAMGLSNDVPPSLRELPKKWGRQAWTRQRVGFSVDSVVDGLRAEVKRIEAGL